MVMSKIGGKLSTKADRVVGEKPMWAGKGEGEVTGNAKEVSPGLIVAGIAAEVAMGILLPMKVF